VAAHLQKRGLQEAHVVSREDGAPTAGTPAPALEYQRHARLTTVCRPVVWQTKRLEKEKEVPTKGGKNKALARMEKELQTENRDLAFMKMRASVATGLAHVLAFSYIYNKFDGHAVARLPFEPFGFIRHLSHRNLPGDDYCDCSVVFFYMMCNMGFKPSLQKLLGVAPSGSGPGSMMSLHQQMAAKLNVQ